jgi:hypothetical protein
MGVSFISISYPATQDYQRESTVVVKTKEPMLRQTKNKDGLKRKPPSKQWHNNSSRHTVEIKKLTTVTAQTAVKAVSTIKKLD